MVALHSGCSMPDMCESATDSASGAAVLAETALRTTSMPMLSGKLSLP